MLKSTDLNEFKHVYYFCLSHLWEAGVESMCKIQVYSYTPLIVECMTQGYI